MFFDQFSEVEQQILQERARRIARNAQDNEASESFSVLRILVRHEHYAVHLDDLVAIYREADIIPVPCTPNFLKGIANVRGRIMSVVDLGTALDVPNSATGKQGQLIVVEKDQETLALFVEQVEDVTSYTQSDIEYVPADMNTGQVYTSGILEDGTLLLDIHALIQDSKFLIES